MKIFRSYKNLLAATVFFASVVGVAALMLIDGENNLRSPFLNNNFLSRFIEKVGIERIDFSAKGFACFCITYLDVLALFFGYAVFPHVGVIFPHSKSEIQFTALLFCHNIAIYRRICRKSVFFGNGAV